MSILPSEAFQLLEVSLDVFAGLSHKDSVNHPLLLGVSGLNVVYVQDTSQAFIDVGGSLIQLLDYHCDFGHI